MTTVSILLLIYLHVETTLSGLLVYPYPMVIGRPITLNNSFALMKKWDVPVGIIKQVKEVRIMMLSDENKTTTPKFTIALHPQNQHDERTEYSGYPANVTVSYLGVDAVAGSFPGEAILRKVGLIVTFHQAPCLLIGVVQYLYQVLGPPESFYERGTITRNLFLDNFNHRPVVRLHPSYWPGDYGHSQTVICEGTASTARAKIGIFFKPEGYHEFNSVITRTALLDLPHLSRWPKRNERKTVRSLSTTCEGSRKNSYLYKTEITFKVLNRKLLKMDIACIFTVTPWSYLPNGTLVKAFEEHQFTFRFLECMSGRKRCYRPGVDFGHYTQSDKGDFTDIYKESSHTIIALERDRSEEEKRGKSSFPSLYIVAGLIVTSLVVLTSLSIYRERVERRETDEAAVIDW